MYGRVHHPPPPQTYKCRTNSSRSRCFISSSPRFARRSDLIGEYVGHSATKTQKVIDEAMGGVLFIDEVYALGNGGSKKGSGDSGSKSDSFSTECINTLNQNLTERKGEFICIIAGYKTETERHFFDLNPGLRRRFSFYYTIDAYDWNELTRILLFKIDKLTHWNAADGLGTVLLDDGNSHGRHNGSAAFLKDKMADFPHYAGDVRDVATEHQDCALQAGLWET